MKYENDFQAAEKLEDKARAELFAKLAVDNNETSDNIESQYAMWLAGRDPCDSRSAAFEAIESLGAEPSTEAVRFVLKKLAEVKDLSPLELDDALRAIAEKQGKSTQRKQDTLKKEFVGFQKSANKRSRTKSGNDPQGTRLILQDWNKRMTPDSVLKSVREHMEKRNAGTLRMFRRGSEIVRVVRDINDQSDTQVVRASALDKYQIALEVERETTWVRFTEDGTPVYCEMPQGYAEKLRKDPDFKLPVLNDFTEVPYFTTSGELVMTPGYNEETGVYYQPPPKGLDIGEPPKNITREQAEAALWSALYPYLDMPFRDGDDTEDRRRGHSSLVNTLARDLTPYLRLMNGATPMFAISKTEHGAGGSLHSKVGSIIATGREPTVETIKESPAEWRKECLAHALAGTKRICIDNVPRDYVFDDPTIAAVATADSVGGRILGKSEVASGLVTWIFEINGMQLKFSYENARRTVMIAIDPRMSNPGERTDFRIKEPLEEWVKTHRAEIVRAHLTLIQYWIEQGMPPWSGKALASFEKWSRNIGGILEVVGIGKHFDGNRHLLSGEDSRGMSEFLQRWLDADRTVWRKQAGPPKRSEDSSRTLPARCGRLQWGDVPDAAFPKSLAELYASMDSGYIGVSRDTLKYETLGQRLGKRLSEHVGSTHRLVTFRERGKTILHDYVLEKNQRDSAGESYVLVRVEGSERITTHGTTAKTQEEILAELKNVAAAAAMVKGDD